MAKAAKSKTRHRGRIPGSKNKATIEKAIIAEQINDRAKMKNGNPLAKEVLEKFMMLFAGMASQEQALLINPPEATAEDRNPRRGSIDQLERWAKNAIDTAAKLAPYQSPTFRAIITTPPPDPNAMLGPQIIDLKIFEGGLLIEHLTDEDET